MAIISNGTTVASGGSVRGSASNLTGISTPTGSNQVGTYVLGRGDNSTKYYGATESANSITPTTNDSYYIQAGSTWSYSGTWRCMGYKTNANQGRARATLWVRIS